MRHAFRDILDEKLAGGPTQETAASRRYSGIGTVPLHRLHVQAGASISSFSPRSNPYARNGGVLRDPQPANRARRALTPRAQRALETLAALGAPLATDFTQEELRKAFRTLARRYHPDRHPGSHREQANRLARLFAELHQAYRELQNLDAVAA